MSDFGWIRGSYKIPSNQWNNFRNSIIEEYNQKVLKSYELALKVYEIIKDNKKGKRNYPLENEIVKLLEYNEKEYFWRDKILTSLITSNKLIKPKKKDFPKVKNTIDSIEGEELTLIFNNKEKVIEFYSDDNTHSQDNAPRSYLGLVFFRRLDRIKWTSKTGGYLRYYNEHRRDHGLSASPCYIKGKYTKPKYFKLIQD